MTISDCVIKSKKGIVISYSENVTLDNVKVHPSEGEEPLTVINSENVVSK